MEAKKKAFFNAMVATFGNITEASKIARINRKTFYEWKNNDPEFKEAVEGEDYEEALLDMIDDGLRKLAIKKNVPVLIFLAKTKGKKRGYIERNEITGKDGTPFNVIMQPASGCEPISDAD